MDSTRELLIYKKIVKYIIKNHNSSSISIKTHDRVVMESERMLHRFARWFYDRSITNRRVQYAFFGTTSSGKTTLINSLIGESVLPTDADELSLGVIHIQNRQSMIDPTIQFHNHQYNNIDLYLDHTPTIQRRIASYLKALREIEHRKKITTLMPRITLRFPIRIGSEIFFDANPDTIELIDLPGLRIAQDKINSPAIEFYAYKPVPVIVVDVCQPYVVEPLNELLDLIIKNEYILKGITPCVVFNKIDAWSHDNEPILNITERIQNRIATRIQCQVHGIHASAFAIRDALILRKISSESILNPSLNNQQKMTLTKIARTHKKFIYMSTEKNEENQQKIITALHKLDDLGRKPLTVCSEDVNIVARALFDYGGGFGLKNILSNIHKKSTSLLEQENFLSRDIIHIVNEEQKEINTISSIEEIRSRVIMLAEMFRRVIEVDGIIHESELELAKILLEEYTILFYNKDLFTIINMSTLDLLNQTHNKHISITSDKIQNDEINWTLDALEMLAAADWNIDPRELAIIDDLKNNLKHKI
jgi:GTPase SAR1 family protein